MPERMPHQVWMPKLKRRWSHGFHAQSEFDATSEAEPGYDTMFWKCTKIKSDRPQLKIQTSVIKQYEPQPL